MESINIFTGIIRGGRGDTFYEVSQPFDMPIDMDDDDFRIFLEGENPIRENILPNSESDTVDMFQSLIQGNVWVGWDSFGEGVIGIAPSGTEPDELELKVRRFYMGEMP